jgi:alpha-tubulin suppressor-like RCC1 family protein
MPRIPPSLAAPLLALLLAGCATTVGDEPDGGWPGGDGGGDGDGAPGDGTGGDLDGSAGDADPPGDPCGGGGTDACFHRPIALGEMFACAIRGNGRVACWGDGRWGALGTGSEADNPTPIELLSLADVAQVTAGAKHACALLESSEVWCWGYNTFNQLGTGSPDGPDTCNDGGATSSVRCSRVPVKVAGLPGDVVQVEAGKYYTCALSASGKMYCWGSAQDGVLGNGETTGPFPGAVESTVANGAGAIEMLAPGNRHNCVLLRAGTDRVRCWGWQGNGRVGNGSFDSAAVLTPQTVTQADVVFLSSGEDQSCLVTAGGTVRCWGENGQYELGNGTTTASSTPTDVVNQVSTRVVSVEIGDSLGHVCTATTAGGAQCWGSNSSGECGDGTTSARMTAVNVSGLTGVVHIGTGIYHSCSFHADGTVRCWGMRSQCQMGDGNCTAGTEPTPVQVSNFP